jgi:hypothetical protein
MAQPTEDVRWADTTGVNLTEPVSGLKDVGYVTGAVPTAQNHNWLFNAYWKWIEYLKNLTSEKLTWLKKQTFNSDSNIEPAILANGLDWNSGTPNPTIQVDGGDYTGAVPSTLAGIAVNAIGGASTSGDGGAAFDGVGGLGQQGGYGGDFLGGSSTNASTLGGTGVRAIGGDNVASDKGGTGLEAMGADGDVWNGNGGKVTAGDLTAQGIGVTLRTGLTVFGGSCFTDGTKTTLGTTPNVEAAFAVLPGKIDDGGGSYSVTGINVQENTAGALAPFTKSQWGITMGSGYMLKQDPINSTTYPAGANIQLPDGVLAPQGMPYAVARVRFQRTGGTTTASLVSGADRLNVNAPTHPTTTTFNIPFSRNALGNATPSVSMTLIGGTARALNSTFVNDWRWHVETFQTALLVKAYDPGTIGTPDIDFDASGDFDITFQFLVFGR